MDMPRRDAHGRVWHFRVWHDFIRGRYVQRIFFWDEARHEMGIAEFQPGLRLTQLKQRIGKLLSDAAYRRRFHRSLSFPIEQHYDQPQLPQHEEVTA